MRLVALLVVLVGCAFHDNEWPKGARAKPVLVDVPESIMPEWRTTVAQSLAVWDSRVNLDGTCPLPIALARVDEDSDCEVRLISEQAWTRPGVSGAEHYCYVDIRGNDATERQAILTHEFGHAIGLEHSEDPASIMHAHVSTNTPTAADVLDAHAALGCD